MLIIRYVIWLFYCLHDFIAIDQLKIEISEGSARAVVAYVKLVKMNRLEKFEVRAQRNGA